MCLVPSAFKNQSQGIRSWPQLICWSFSQEANLGPVLLSMNPPAAAEVSGGGLRKDQTALPSAYCWWLALMERAITRKILLLLHLRNQGGITTLFLCFPFFFFFFNMHTAVKPPCSLWDVCSPVEKTANTSHSEGDSFQPCGLSWMVDLRKHVFHSLKKKKKATLNTFWCHPLEPWGAMCHTPLLYRPCFYRLCVSLPEIYCPSEETHRLCLCSGNVAMHLLRTSLWFTRIFVFPSEVSI